MSPRWLLAAAVLLASCAPITQSQTAQADDLDALKSNGCGMTGDARDPDTQALDKLKNRHEAPTEIDKSATLAAMSAAKSGSNTFDSSKGAEVEGYLVKVTLEKGESCNCHSTAKEDWDFHCYLAPTKNPSLNERLVVEVTPRMRKWTLAQMRAMIGKRLKVTGWILDDAKHRDASEADTPGNEKNWRASTWEIHPVMAIQVVP